MDWKGLAASIKIHPWPGVLLRWDISTMRTLLLLVFLGTFLTACGQKRLAKRVRGTWLIDHYDEWSAARKTGHELDRSGYLYFGANGVGSTRLSPGAPPSLLHRLPSFRYAAVSDSVVEVYDATGATAERWLVTKNYGTYMEWVSVTDTRDTVRTMYLMRR